MTPSPSRSALWLLPFVLLACVGEPGNAKDSGLSCDSGDCSGAAGAEGGGGSQNGGDDPGDADPGNNTDGSGTCPMESSGICLAFEQYADAEAQCPGTVSAATCASQGFTLGTCAIPEGAAPVPVEGWFHPDMYTAAAAEEICAGAGGTWN